MRKTSIEELIYRRQLVARALLAGVAIGFLLAIAIILLIQGSM